MDIEKINNKYEACKTSFKSDNFYELAENLVKEILLPGECVDFKGSNVNGIYYDVLFNGIERSKENDIIFNAHFDCEYGIKNFCIRQIPNEVALCCIDKLLLLLPEIQANRERKEWFDIYKHHLKGCFKFWNKQGCNIYEALSHSIEETSNLKNDPRVPKGKEVDKKVLEDFLYPWEQALNQLATKIKDDTYDEEDIRICDICGLPMFEGYYLGGEFACDEECCLESYEGDTAQMEEDLSHADEDFGECYWTEWYSIFFDY